MSRADLFVAAKSRLGITKDVELAAQLGVGRSFLCLVKQGHKNLPDAMKTRLMALCGWLAEEVDQLIQKGEEHALPPVSLVQREVQLQSGVLPDTAPDVHPVVAAQPALGAVEGPRGQGGGQQADLTGESGESAPPQVARVKLKRGTRAATILIAGRVYYPEKKSDHTHRRVISIVRREGHPPAVIYSTGDDRNHICNRNTFIRWMDPTRYHNGQSEVRLAGTGAEACEPEKQAAPPPKRHRKGKADETVAA